MTAVMRCVWLRIVEAAEGGLCLLEVLAMLEMSEVIRGALLCSLEVLEVLELPETMRGVLGTLYAGGCGRWAFSSVSRFLNFHRGRFLVTVRQQFPACAGESNDRACH